MLRRFPLAAALAALYLAAPAAVLAHPLGNFTINHYAGITVTPESIELDVVIDMAEIPTFQERLLIDADGDGEVTDAEAAAAAPGECRSIADAITLRVDGALATITRGAASISFPAGLGGLSTMRIECALSAALPSLASGATIDFEDGSHADRIGWREIVVAGRGVSVDAAGLPSTSISARLTDYPKDLISQPLDVRRATIVASPGGVVASPGAGAGGGAAPVSAPATSGGAAVPGGVALADVPDIFRSVDLTPVVLVVSLLTALALGAQHAVTPGHGKTLMAAYLVGTRGRPLHAVGLGLAVAVSHTIGILILTAVVVGAQGLLPPDIVVRTLPVLAAAGIVVIGGWMLATETGRRASRRRAVRTGGDDHGHGHGDRDGDDADGHEEPGHAQSHADAGLAHGHGGIRHSHAPAAATSVSWRSLGALGLAGGLIPSTSALFILLGSIVAARPAFGFVLVVAFGLGMALVMAAVGLAIVYARDRVGRLSARPGVARVAELAPLGAAVVVVAVGLFLTAQALVGPPAL